MPLAQDKIASLQKLTALTAWENLSIDGVLDSFTALSSLDTSLVASSSRSGAHTLRLREDSVTPSSVSPERLLSASPERVVAHQIALSSIMHGE